MKINLQFFGGRGASAGGSSAGGASTSNRWQSLQDEVSNLTFTRDMDTLKDMQNMGKLADVVDEVPVGSKISIVQSTGNVAGASMTYTKTGENEWEGKFSGPAPTTESGYASYSFDADGVTENITSRLTGSFAGGKLKLKVK